MLVLVALLVVWSLGKVYLTLGTFSVDTDRQLDLKMLLLDTDLAYMRA